jgi:DNA-binding transcriptional LysR family regulator
MDTIPQRDDGGDIDLHHLQVLDVLLKERSLTKTGLVLDLTQPAISKTLARLRRYFDDPLFIRVGTRMEPTPKAAELTEPVRAIIDRMRTLRSDRVAFDAKTSDRTFKFFMVDAAVVQMLPPLLEYLRVAAPQMHVQAERCDVQHLDLWLESGLVDFAVGSFTVLGGGIRRHPLWSETYVAVARKDHPRITPAPSLDAFVAEQHALVTAVGTGHDYVAAERTLEAAIPRQNIVCRIPMFAAAAHIVKHSDVIATLPRTVARTMANDLDLQLVEVPIALPTMEIAEYWHERYHRDPGNVWIRGAFRTLFLNQVAAPPAKASATAS